MIFILVVLYLMVLMLVGTLIVEKYRSEMMSIAVTVEKYDKNKGEYLKNNLWCKLGIIEDFISEGNYFNSEEISNSIKKMEMYRNIGYIWLAVTILSCMLFLPYISSIIEDKKDPTRKEFLEKQYQEFLDKNYSTIGVTNNTKQE